MLNEFDLPLHSDAPYFDQYMGIWAIQEEALQAHCEFARNLNLQLHLHSDQAAMAREAGSSANVSKSDQVAVVNITGSLMKQASSMSGGTSTLRVRQAIRSLAADSEIGAIVLRIDSPGGTVAGTEELASDIAAASKKKPVLAFIEDLGASAAYWIASQTQEISANATALVGSIGTYGVVQDLSAMAAKEGVKVHVVRAGTYKGTGVPGTEITQAQIGEMQRTVDALNSHFLDGVASGRHMTKEQVSSLADGRVHIASEAKKMGLIDSVSTLDQTIERARMLARSGTSKPKGQKMSDTTVASEPVLATADQIEAACPGCDAGFIVSQLKRPATLDQAKSAWMVEMSNRLKAQAEEVTKAKAEAEAAKRESAKTSVVQSGVDPITANMEINAVVAAGTAQEQWSTSLAEYRRKGMSADAAVIAADKANPGLREQMLAEVNANRKPSRR